MEAKRTTEKVLTISVAAYNMEHYIRETLDSLADSRVIKDLEVFVIDDGGTDGTLDIAKEYAERYPDSIFPIHKENGGYGSTVNYSVAHATGKYFKLLDGDDWFNTEELIKLVSYLKNADVDVIVTQTCAGPDRGDLRLNEINWLKEDQVFSLHELTVVKPIPMWSVTFLTEVVRKSWIDLPEKMFYTDVLYVLRSLSHAEHLLFRKDCVYCYRENRAGNSTNRASLAKHYSQHMQIAKMCAEYYASRTAETRFPLLRACAGMPYVSAARGLMYAPASAKTRNELKEYDKWLKNLSPELYSETEKYGKTGKMLKWIRKTRYMVYWLLLLYR